VNHLTRMQPGYICVAGINLQNNAHVRPVLAGARLTTDMLKRLGGPFDVAVVVDLGAAHPCGNPPETEDHVFDPNEIVEVRQMGPDQFWRLINSVSRRTLAEIFGDQLKVQSTGCAIKEGRGSVSLGSLLSITPPEIYINSWGKLRAWVSDGAFNGDLSVTDLRFYRKDQQTPRRNLVANVQRRINKGVGVILSVGLARAFQARGDTARRHWLQVNNIHLDDDPTWQVG
jgi:Dual OB-containing domain